MKIYQLLLLGTLSAYSVCADATPYVYISTPDELTAFRDAVNKSKEVTAVDDQSKEYTLVAAKTANVLLVDDIDLSGISEWTPIGLNDSYTFSGVFDGGNKTIRNLHIGKSLDFAGLFGYVSKGTIKNLTVTGYINSSVNNVGGIASVAANNSVIDNCHNECKVVGYSYVGGILGQRNSCVITNCTNRGLISGNERVGGIVGQYKGQMTNCINYGTITGKSNVGGLIGYCSSLTGTTLSSCYNYGDIVYNGDLNKCGVLVGLSGFSQTNDCFYSPLASYPANIAKNGAAELVPDVVYFGDGTSSPVVQTADFAPDDNSFLVTTNANIGGYNVVINNNGVYSCKEFRLVDGQPFSTPIDFTVEKLFYNRATTASKIVTMVLPADILLDHLRCNVFVFDKFDGSNVHFTSYENARIEANTPYVIKPEDAETAILEDGTTLATIKAADISEMTYSGLSNFGVYEQSTFQSDEHFSYIVFSGGSLKKYSKINLGPFRAGFRLDLDNANSSATLGIFLDDELTGVITTESGQVADGRIDVYDIQGRIVRTNVEQTTCFEGLKKGIYIVNGTKFKIDPKASPLPTVNSLKSTTDSTGIAE